MKLFIAFGITPIYNDRFLALWTRLSAKFWDTLGMPIKTHTGSTCKGLSHSIDPKTDRIYPRNAYHDETPDLQEESLGSRRKNKEKNW